MVATRWPAFSSATAICMRGGGLARATLLVAEHDDVRGLRPSLHRFDQHDTPLMAPILKYAPALVKLSSPDLIIGSLTIHR